MEAFLISTGIVALAEIGDKTQLLSFFLAARFKRPWPICMGILVATLANHACAGALGQWLTTLMAFFLAEMGDKTQIATVALAARFDAFLPVVIGTTAGMMLANVPAVLIGDRLAERLPVRLVHGVAAAVFAVLGVLALLGADGWFS